VINKIKNTLFNIEITPKEAVASQKRMAAAVVTDSDFVSIGHVAGIDVSFRAGIANAAAVTLTFPGMKVVETASAMRKVTFPYIPGLLAFREAPVALEAFAKLSTSPDLLVIDGHGIAHPRRFGLACHLGVALDIPSIGCAKSRLTGQWREPARRRGSSTRLIAGEEVIGRVVRTRDGVKPVFISTGHKVSLKDAVRLVLGMATKYRLPEPIRHAHIAAGRF